MDFQIAELPGHVNYFTPDFNQANIFAEIGAVIWVIDAQDQYLDALNQLIDTITYLAQTWPAINVEVFVHKVDGLSEEYKNDTFRDIRQRILDELSDLGYDNAPVSFYQTSIYDHSVFESISKVIQKLLPQLPTLESLLNSLCSTCRIQKAYLFDIITKIYIASDTSPQDTNSYEICSDLIDVVVDIGELYGWARPKEEQTERTEFGNHACESMVTMEKKGQNYLYLREMNRCVWICQRRIWWKLTAVQISRPGVHHGRRQPHGEEGPHRLQCWCLPGSPCQGLSMVISGNVREDGEHIQHMTAICTY